MKRICILLIILTLCFGLLTPAANAAFADISDQTTDTAATLLKNLGIVDGYSDGGFHPNDTLTRAQFCKMAVLLSGTRDLAAYAGFTIFPDVRAEHWSSMYVNAAARGLKIITGFPDGTFKPDAPISFAQAVTTLMRLLGYSDSDVGLSWPQGYLDKARQIGLTKGVNLNANDAIKRGLGAQMFYNAIFATNKDGARYYDTLGFTEQKVIILRQNGVSPDGLTEGLVTLGGDGFYPYRTAPDVEEGAQGMLLIDGDGYALSWTPDKQTTRDITVRDTGPMSVTGADGTKLDNIPSGAMVLLNGEKTTWETSWLDVPRGLTLRVYFNAAGAIDYIFLNQPADTGLVKILASEPAAGRNPLPGLGIDPQAQVFKNGVRATWADLRQYDVLVHNEETNTVNATDFRITAIYENALPNREAPDEVTTLGGKSFKLLPDARPKLAASRIGDALTFFFTADGRVADIRPADKPAFQPGITTGDKSVMLYNGMIISGDDVLTAQFSEGTPVLACMQQPGKLRLQAITAKGGVELDASLMKAGDADIAPYAVFFDLSGVGGRAAQVGLPSLPDTVAAGSVLAVSLDSGGRANLIVTRNVTGDAWLYGFTSFERGSYEGSTITDENGDSQTIYSYLPNQAFIDNQSGRQTFDDPKSLCKNSGSSVYAVAIGTNGYVLASQACVRVNNVSRSDFVGSSSLMVSGVLRPIPDGLMVYVQATKEYITIAEARLYSNNFTVFLDKPASDGGKPRFIVAL